MSERRSNSWLSRQQLWVFAIGGLFLADFVLYGYLPSRERLRSLVEAKTRRTQLIAAAEAHSDVLPSLTERLRETDRYVRNYEDWIPCESALGQFLGQIAQIMTKNNLSDQDVVLGQERVSDDLICIPVHMKCVGNLNGIFGFFQDLQNLGRLVRIEKTTLVNAKAFTGSVTMDADAVIFYRTRKTQNASLSANQNTTDAVNDEA
jgi:Tfp pilus assembly protein PilO